jgi:RHS repeat-associated protein
MRLDDAAGELTKDSSNATAHTYQWDAEGRVSSVDNGATWGFTYNALGHRVQWTYSNGAGAYQQMFDPNGGWLGIYGALDVLRRGDGAYAWYNGTETYFNHINNLSSTKMMTNHAGAPVEDVLFYPWGQAWNTWGSGGYNFAELPYDDPTTNTNLATFRLQSPSLGRWLSPDPLGGDITNPQSLNLYPYVMNNPTSLVDPLGLQEECSQSNDPYDCCNDPNYIGAECGGPGWPPGFWPPINWGGFGGGGPTVSLPGGAGPSDAALGNEWVNTLPCLGPQATIDLAAALIGIVNGRFGTNIQNNSSQVYYANPTEGLTVVAMVQPGGIVPTNGIGDFGNTS